MAGWVLGIDPGANGAALLVSPSRRACVLWVWLERKENKAPCFDVSISQLGAGPRVARVYYQGEIGNLIAGGAARVSGGAEVSVFCEDAQVGRSPRASIVSARRAGLIVGVFEPDFGTARFISPPRWRSLVLPPSWQRASRKRAVAAGEKWVKRDAAKAETKRQMPIHMPDLVRLIDESAKAHGVRRGRVDEAACDAAGVAFAGVLGG